MTAGFFRSGSGIRFDEEQVYVEGEYLKATVINVDMDNDDTAQINANNINPASGKPGDVLTISGTGHVVWTNPFKEDEKLREEYPSFECAYQNLLVALYEYETVKKMVKDYD